MAESSYNVGDLVAEFLARIGVTTCFGIVSVHNIPMLDGIGRRNAIRYVMARNEMGGAHMADAYARVSGHLGVIFTSTGPGAANAVAGLVEAQFAGSPVLHITGQTPTRFIDRDMGSVHDVPGQTAMLAAVCKSAFRVRSAAEALGVLTRAATLALTPPMGPVSVEIPIDIQRTVIPRPAMLDSLVLPVPPPLPPSEAALEEAVEILARAKRPMLWLGNGAKSAGPEALQLLELGFGVVSSWNGRGIVAEDHPMSLGGLHGNGSPRVIEFYRSCDAMLVVGSKLRGHETMEFSLKLPEPLVQVDVDPAACGRTYPSAAFVCGDAGLTMAALAQRLRGRMQVDPGFAADFAAMKRQAVAAYCDTLGPYAEFPARLRTALPRDALWVRDITISNSSWGNRIFPVYGPRDAVHPVSAAIGPGLPLGIGAALAGGGRKAIAMVGDGGFALNQTELWTAVQERAELVVMVMNDRGYGVIKHIQGALQDGRMFYGDLQGPDLQQLAAVAGLPGFRVSSVEELGPVVAKAVATPGPSLVEVDMQAIGAFPPYAPYNNMGIYAKRAAE
ncbi:thiamine pyrophosphate-binding protein [Siccirubricoccus sp. KC 17139]|uniref:Thiamine pyrophosphate-binding protein n=1 Tax=Siccirubricoccus soli TaxID=2899147 RepID=A0ABT1DDJ2_9PROT|nr:thiamine pyrophosphate-binding protein [Siccirubricoccus soli]MCO6419993.1 thiamine pyrophosphate-binding protein [Siccirubricoccus soli]MCP2686128.1 thiamine pyrophosphate-binding protein [Siccirubricoccus soli]